MKKLLLAIVGLFVFVPVMAKAAAIPDLSCTKDQSQMFRGDSNTCTVYVTADTAFSDYTASITPNGPKVTVSDVTALGSFTGTTTTTNVALTSATPIPAGQKVEVFKFTYTLAMDFDYATDACGVGIDVIISNIPNIPQIRYCKVEGGKYYGKNGNEVTQAQYQSECLPKKVCVIENGKYYGKNGTEITKEQYESDCAKNPATGTNILPYILIGATAIIAIGAYVFVRRQNKFSRI